MPKKTENTETKEVRKTNDKAGVTQPMAQTITNRFVLFDLVSVALATLAFALGSNYIETVSAVIECFCQAVASELIFMAAFSAVHIALYRQGLDSRMVMSSIKSFDPKFTGMISDINGTGILLGSLTAVAAAFTELFVVDNGALFDNSLFYVYLICAASKCITIFCAISAMFSSSTLFLLFASNAAASGNVKGNDVIKLCSRASHYPDLMGRFRRITAIHTSTGISVALLAIIASLTAVKMPYYPSAMVIFLAVLMTLTLSTPKKSELIKEEEPSKLLTKKSTVFITVNVVMYLVCGIMMLYSFPFRSVYTDYVVRHDFEYNAVISEKPEIFSLPPQNSTGDPLFHGLFVITALFIVMQYLSTVLYDDNSFDGTSGGAPANFVMALFIAGLYSFIHMTIYPTSSMNAIMWLVCMSIGCLMLGIDLIRVLVSAKRDDKKES